jgi:hypothetical protein
MTDLQRAYEALLEAGLAIDEIAPTITDATALAVLEPIREHIREGKDELVRLMNSGR